MLTTHQIVTTVLLSLHRTEISLYRAEKKIDNVLTHYKIAVTFSLRVKMIQTDSQFWRNSFTRITKSFWPNDLTIFSDIKDFHILGDS